MGTEILIVFMLVPICLCAFDVYKMLKRQNLKRHFMLLGIGLVGVGYMALSSYLSGFNPMQGVVIASLFYGPAYLLLFSLIRDFVES